MGNNVSSDKLESVEGIGEFTKLFAAQKDKPRGMMWQVWHDLQVYACWGNKLPSTEEQLKLDLHITETAQYGFFPLMLESYRGVSGSCGTFINDTFPAVVKLGNDVKAFAKDASDPGESGIFTNITSMMQAGNLDDALVLLKDLQAQATSNANKAGDIAGKLSTFKTSLTGHTSKLDSVKVQVEADEKTSDATIKALGGDGKEGGEIKKLLAELEQDQEQYKQDVIIASTTPTYCWIMPFGLIAAIITAGIYGQRAREMLVEIKRITGELATKDQELRIAIAVRNVQSAAEKGVTQALTRTQNAIDALTSLQNGWSKIAAGLDGVCSAALKMSSEDKLKSIAIVNVYAGMARKAWGDLIGPLNELLEEPYIKVAPDVVALKKEIDALPDAGKVAA
jgi:hypothetical protein